jgi:hypothetical protein
MRKSITTPSSSIHTSIAGVLLSGIAMIGGCGELDNAIPSETDSSQQALLPTGPGAEVWRADMGVTVSATKDSIAKKITYIFEATNQGDDDARAVVMAAHFPPGVTVSMSNKGAFDSCSSAISTGSANSYIQCNLTSLGVRAKAILTVTVSNPTNAASQASAQVFNISPDPIVDNNYAQVSVP